MLSGIWNFVKRHKKKLIFTGVLIGGVWTLGKYAKRRMLEYQEKEAEECLAHARRQHHFDSNQRTCNMTVLSMLPSLREAISALINTEDLIEHLRTNPADKLTVWEQLKVMSFSRSIVSVYSISILISMLRVQLNIIGGYIFLDTMVSHPEENDDLVKATPRSQEQYLATIQYVLNKGLDDLATTVNEQVAKAVGHMSLKQQVSLADIQTIITTVRNGVEFRQTSGYHDAQTSSLVQYMLSEETPSTDEEATMSSEEKFLHRLSLETRDMLESGDFHSVLTTLLDSAFLRLMDFYAQSFKPTVEENGKMNSPNDISMPMAKLIPISNGLIHTVCADAPNPFVQELLLKDQMKNFAANIYEAFSQPDGPQHMRS